MSFTESYIARLALKKINGSLTPAEAADLAAWQASSPEHLQTLKRITDLHELKEDLHIWLDLHDKAQAINAPDVGHTAAHSSPAIHRVHFLRNWGWAAAVVFLMGITMMIATFSGHRSDSPVSALSENIPASEILAGDNKAILTLSDGSTIELNSASNGVIAKQGSSSIVKLANGEIVYRPEGIDPNEIMMNTMSTPRGGQYKLRLPDGSLVWLNAASSITYPTAFVGDHRKIKVTGEVYLEVAKDKSRPFRVDVAGGSAVEVLGTSFNINCYADDDEKIMTTLVEGSIKVSDPSRAGKSAILIPGQQAVFARGGIGDITVQPADIEQTLAWKNGLFDLTNMTLKSFRNQLERWYDINIRYDGSAPELVFQGKINRAVPLSDIIRFLDEMQIKTRLEGRTLIIEGQGSLE